MFLKCLSEKFIDIDENIVYYFTEVLKLKNKFHLFNINSRQELVKTGFDKYVYMEGKYITLKERGKFCNNIKHILKNEIGNLYIDISIWGDRDFSFFDMIPENVYRIDINFQRGVNFEMLFNLIEKRFKNLHEVVLRDYRYNFYEMSIFNSTIHILDFQMEVHNLVLECEKLNKMYDYNRVSNIIKKTDNKVEMLQNYEFKKYI